MLESTEKEKMKGTGRPNMNSEVAAATETFMAPLLMKGLIEKADNSEPAMRPVIVRKGDNIRLTVATAPLKSLTNKLPMPSLNIPNALAEINPNHKYVMTANIYKAFWQKKIHPDQANQQVVWLPSLPQNDLDEVQQTGKITNKGNCRWSKYKINSLLQGSPNGTAISQISNENLIEQANLPSTCSTLVHVDDTFIFSSTIEEHIQNVNKYLDECRRQGIQISLNKFIAISKQNHPLSHTWTNGTTTVPEGYRQALSNNPTNAELLKITQSLNYYNHLIEEFALKTAPIRDAGAEHAKQQAPEEHINIILNLLNDLKKSEVRSIPPNEKLILITDFSCKGKAATLTTMDKRPIRFTSERNTPTEAAMSSPDGEITTGIFAMKKFDYLLRGREFIWKTDSQAVVKSIQKYEAEGAPSDFQARRHHTLANYNFSIEHTPGESICADFPSRNFPKTELLCNNLLLEAAAIHNKTHCSARRLKRQLLEKKIRLPNSEIKTILTNCLTCQKARSLPVQLQPSNIKIPEEHQRKGSAYTMDQGFLGNKWTIVTIQDIFSKELKILLKKGNHNSDDIYPHLPPTAQYIIVDNGAEFEGNFFRQANLNNLTIFKPPPHHKQANGMAERAIRTVKIDLRAAGIESSDSYEKIRKQLDIITTQYNNSPHI